MRINYIKARESHYTRNEENVVTTMFSTDKNKK